MAALTIRDLDEDVKQNLRIRAAHRQHSMEEEVWCWSTRGQRDNGQGRQAARIAAKRRDQGVRPCPRWRHRKDRVGPSPFADERPGRAVPETNQALGWGDCPDPKRAAKTQSDLPVCTARRAATRGVIKQESAEVISSQQEVLAVTPHAKLLIYNRTYAKAIRIAGLRNSCIM